MTQKRLQFKPAFRWEREVEEFVRSRMAGYTLNAPCGHSTLGDVFVDNDLEIVPEGRNFHHADMMKLPFADQTFDTVISDPPWHLNLFHRPRQFFELFRVCKVGGKILFNATWFPSSKYDVFDIEELYVRSSANFANASLLMTIRKRAEVPP